MWVGSERIHLCASANEEPDSLVNNALLTLGGKGAWRFAVHWSVNEFCNLARQVKHPFDEPPRLPDDVIVAAFNMVVYGPAKTGARITQKVKHWTARAMQLKTKTEERLHSTVPLRRRKLLKSKRNLLFREMLEEAGHPDLQVGEEVINGFNITGDIPTSGVIRPRAANDETRGQAKLGG